MPGIRNLGINKKKKLVTEYLCAGDRMLNKIAKVSQLCIPSLKAGHRDLYFSMSLRFY